MSYPGYFRRPLRIGGQAKRKEHGAKCKDGDFSLHEFLLLFFHF
jgi:hypothetical protein